jgi:hypothetical protein
LDVVPIALAMIILLIIYKVVAVSFFADFFKVNVHTLVLIIGGGLGTYHILTPFVNQEY